MSEDRLLALFVAVMLLCLGTVVWLAADEAKRREERGRARRTLARRLRERR